MYKIEEGKIVEVNEAKPDEVKKNSDGSWKTPKGYLASRNYNLNRILDNKTEKFEKEYIRF